MPLLFKIGNKPGKNEAIVCEFGAFDSVVEAEQRFLCDVSQTVSIRVELYHFSKRCKDFEVSTVLRIAALRGWRSIEVGVFHL